MRDRSTIPLRRRARGLLLSAAGLMLVVQCFAGAALARPGSSPTRHATVISWNAVVLGSGGAADRQASGRFTGPPLGSGAVAYSVHLGPGVRRTLAFHYRVQLFAKAGELTLVIAGIGHDQGQFTILRGTGHVTGGTGRYRHARGRLSLAGEGFVNSSHALANRSTLRGTLLY